jgi:hypothetical protein
MKESLMHMRPLTLARNDFRIVAKGLRNPFRFAVHPINGDLYIGDVGSEIAEEVMIYSPSHQELRLKLTPDQSLAEPVGIQFSRQFRLAVLGRF